MGKSNRRKEENRRPKQEKRKGSQLDERAVTTTRPSESERDRGLAPAAEAESAKALAQAIEDAARLLRDAVVSANRLREEVENQLGTLAQEVRDALHAATWTAAEHSDGSGLLETRSDVVDAPSDTVVGLVVGNGAAANSAERAVIDAVRAFWDLYLEVGARTGPFDLTATRARLAQRATGDMLQQLLTRFAANSAAGFVLRGTIDIAPHVISVGSSIAVVRDCNEELPCLYRLRDGSRVGEHNSKGGQIMTLVRENDVWKISEISDGATADSSLDELAASASPSNENLADGTRFEVPDPVEAPWQLREDMLSDRIAG